MYMNDVDMAAEMVGFNPLSRIRSSLTEIELQETKRETGFNPLSRIRSSLTIPDVVEHPPQREAFQSPIEDSFFSDDCLEFPLDDSMARVGVSIPYRGFVLL